MSEDRDEDRELRIYHAIQGLGPLDPLIEVLSRGELPPWLQEMLASTMESDGDSPTVFVRKDRHRGKSPGRRIELLALQKKRLAAANRVRELQQADPTLPMKEIEWRVSEEFGISRSTIWKALDENAGLFMLNPSQLRMKDCVELFKRTKGITFGTARLMADIRKASKHFRRLGRARVRVVRILEDTPERSEESVVHEVASEADLDAAQLAGYLEHSRFTQAEAGVVVRQNAQPERDEKSIIAEIADEAGLEASKLEKWIKEAKLIQAEMAVERLCAYGQESLEDEIVAKVAKQIGVTPADLRRRLKRTRKSAARKLKRERQ